MPFTEYEIQLLQLFVGQKQGLICYQPDEKTLESILVKLQKLQETL